MKDERLWMRFPIDMHRDEKVKRLDPAVRWTFIEMNGEARLERNDGIFTVADAEFRWPKSHLDALCASHPEAPLVLRGESHYIIRVYAKHQQTEADREALRAKRAAAGAKGGSTKAVASAKQVLSKIKQTVAESESESEIEKDLTNTSHVSQEPYAPNLLDGLDLNHIVLRQALELHSDVEHATDDEINEWGSMVLSKSRQNVKSQTAYLEQAIKNYPGEPLEWFIKKRKKEAKR